MAGVVGTTVQTTNQWNGQLCVNQRRVGCQRRRELHAGPRLGRLQLRIEGSHCRDVTRAQPVPLADRLPTQRHDGRLPVAAECGWAVMHDRAEIVPADVVAISDVLVEVMLAARLDIGPIDPHAAVPVFPALLVP